jgi:hypothetical protein
MGVIELEFGQRVMVMIYLRSEVMSWFAPFIGCLPWRETAVTVGARTEP